MFKRIVALTVGAGLALGTLALTPVAAQAAPTAVSGNVTWRNAAPNASAKPGFAIAFCKTSCNAATGAGALASGYANAGDTSYNTAEMASSLEPGDYRVAVSFNEDPSRNSGYLVKQSNGAYKLTAAASSASLVDVGARADFTVDIPSATTGTVAPSGYSSADVRPVLLTRGGNYSGFRFDVTGARAGTDVTVNFYGCDGNSPVATVRDTRDGNRSITTTPAAGKLGPNWRINIIVTETGKAARNDGWNKFGGSAGNFKCSTSVDSGRGTPSLVAKWGAKKGTAKVGRKLSVKAPTLSATGKRVKATVKYKWTVNGKVVKKSKTLKVKKSYRKKVVVVKVSVVKKGYPTRTKAYKFGRVR